MLKIENLTKSYQGVVAVDDLSLEVESGDIYGFIGHNGAGKSTTLKCIVGVLNFEQGAIYVDGKSIKDSPIETKKVMAFIPDNPDIYDHLTGIQYLNFIADIYGVNKTERLSLIEEYAILLGMKNDLGDLIGSYSHGMKQKLVIISALIHKPKLLVMDEPFVGLDPKATHSLKEVMRKICQDGGAIFFSTHVLEVAEKLCNKIAIIKSGRLIANGATESVIGDKSLEDTFLELTENE